MKVIENMDLLISKSQLLDQSTKQLLYCNKNYSQ